MPYTTVVKADILFKYLDDSNWIVFDVRHELQDLSAGRKAFLAGHIPGAIFLHMDEDLSAPKTGTNGRPPLPDRAEFAEKLAKLGVSTNNQIVVYDAAEGMMASRLWWMLRWCGHETAAVLDGGWAAWQKQANGPISHESRTRAPGDFRTRPSLVATVDTAQVFANLASKERLVLDARGPDRYRGENETIDPVGGHIPGARNRFFRDNLNEQGSFKTSAALREEFAHVLENFAPTQVIAQCGSGVTACHNLLAMEIAGLPGAALYPGSWSEWCSAPSRPVATGNQDPGKDACPPP